MYTNGRYDLLISCQSALEVNDREYVNDMYCSLLIMGLPTCMLRALQR